MGWVVVLGATSGIGRALCRWFASQGRGVIVAARDEREAQVIAQDLAVRYVARSAGIAFSAVDFDQHDAFVARCKELADEGIDGVALCHGSMEEQDAAAHEFELARRMIDINFTSAVSLLGKFADHLEDRQRGFLCVISSVAGDRGRPSNYLYGAAKAGLTTFLQGLRARLAKKNVHVLTVKPGFVDTAMTWGLPGLFLVTSPDAVAADIGRALDKKRNTIYTPWFWRWIMTIIRCIPEPVFKRLNL